MNTRVFPSKFGVHYLSLNYEIHITTPCFFTNNPELGSHGTGELGRNLSNFSLMHLRETPCAAQKQKFAMQVCG